jgi:serine/threonine protein kinase
MELDNQGAGQADSQTEDVRAHMPIRPNTERPIIKLTVGLLSTFNHINAQYYIARKKHLQQQVKTRDGRGGNGRTNAGTDDQDHNLLFTPNEVLNGRYLVKAQIGKGSFGRVVRAHDQKENCDVAIKIIKSKPAFFGQAQTEIAILEALQDDTDKYNIGDRNGSSSASLHPVRGCSEGRR